MMKKGLACLLAVLMLLSFAACTGGTPTDPDNTTEETTAVGEGTLKLAYSKTDTLDPYTCTTETNLQLLRLVFEGLYLPDRTYQPVPVIAESAIMNGTEIHVTLGQVKFSDGSALTATDVVAAFNSAKAAPAYMQRLANVTQANVAAPNIVAFTLEAADPYALSCLDFPVAKMQDDALIGTGRYRIENSGDAVYLVANTQRTGFAPVIQTVMLVPVRDNTTLGRSLEIGNTAFYYDDLSSGRYLRLNAQMREIGINSLVFVGFNAETEALQPAAVRQAITLAVDRRNVVAAAFQGHARETDTPFNPDWYALGVKESAPADGPAAAKALLAETEIVPAETELSVLVNAENGFKLETARLVVQALESLGFKTVLKDYSAEEFNEVFELGSYDLYIGEIRLTANMDLSPLLSPAGAAAIGLSADGKAAQRYAQMLAGDCELMDFVNTFAEDPPFLPLCYRNAVVAYTNAMEGDFTACEGDVFADIESWRYK